MIVMVSASVLFGLGREICKLPKDCGNSFKVFDLKHVCTDYDLDYRQIVPKHMHVEIKSETAAIEDLNSRIRHHLMRFRRKTFRDSKAKHMDISQSSTPIRRAASAGSAAVVMGRPMTR